VELGVYIHYMDRTNNATRRALIGRVERTADIVAAELLAPQHAVIAKMSEQVEPNDATVVSLLCRHFGLPSYYAESYAKRLFEQAKQTKSFCQVLGF
jgi:Zn-dependent peptidase ImmA (M78 family)